MSDSVQKEVIIFFINNHAEKFTEEGQVLECHEEEIAMELKRQFKLRTPLQKIIKDFLRNQKIKEAVIAEKKVSKYRYYFSQKVG